MADQQQPFLVSFPAYTLLSPDDQTPLVLKRGDQKVIPLFTDLDRVKAYVERGQVFCAVASMADPAELNRFLSRFKPGDLVGLDPLDDRLGMITVYSVAQVLAAIG
jgi:hypothetical protein